MTARAELAKASKRGIELDEDEVELEHARERFHKRRSDKRAAEDFRWAQRRVAEKRTARRLEREAAGPPEGADVVRDAEGVIRGWHIGPDAVAMPGGAQG